MDNPLYGYQLLYSITIATIILSSGPGFQRNSLFREGYYRDTDAIRYSESDYHMHDSQCWRVYLSKNTRFSNIQLYILNTFSWYLSVFIKSNNFPFLVHIFFLFSIQLKKKLISVVQSKNNVM